MKKVLITGVAGFIGFSLVSKMAKDNNFVIIGIDNINAYYDTKLKYARLGECGISEEDIFYGKPVKSCIYPNYSFIKLDITDYESLKILFEENQFNIVIHLAAQAGVRYSIENPFSYVQSNLVGFTNVLECCRHYKIRHLLYASSSSVYGMNNKIPFSEEDNVDYPVSFYAATKKSNELMAHSYSHLYKLPATGLRFFTVYGPWGRPDMAPVIFARAILKGIPLKVFNNGNMLRDFTFIDDITEEITRLIPLIPDREEKQPYYRILNIGNSQPVRLLDFIGELEAALGRQAILNMQPFQPGDVKETYANTLKLESFTHYKPSVTLKEGIRIFCDWYKNYSGI